MQSNTRTLFDRSLFSLKFVNYEIHVLHHSFTLFAQKYAWFSLPLSFIGLIVVWSIYWIVYSLLLVFTLLSFIILPLEKKIRKVNV